MGISGIEDADPPQRLVASACASRTILAAAGPHV